MQVSRQVSLLCAMLTFVAIASSQQVVVNELYNSSATDEWIELLVVQDSLDMRGWDLRDFSSGGAPQAQLDFTTSTLWSNLRAGTLIVVTRPEVTIIEDTDPSDYLVIIKGGNALYFTGNPFQFAGASEAIQIRNASDVHVFGVSWGPANAASIPTPKVHFTGTSTSNTSISFNEDSVPELSVTTNWTVNNASATQGLGNTATNLAWINTFRARADGSGSASMQPDTLNGGDTGPIVITYRRDTQFNITDLRVIIPTGFIWGQTPADVSFTNMTATTSVNGDTISITGIVFSADSTVITINNVEAADSTAIYLFKVQSRVNQYGDVAPTPRVVVFGNPESIASIKVNDANGVMLRANQLVTVRGIVTVANEFGGPSYFQDNSGGLGVFGSAFSTAVSVGDEVIVSGIIQPFSGLSEIVNPILHQIVSNGNVLVPLLVTASQIANDGAGGVEQYEAGLVRLNGVTVSGSGVWAANTNYNLQDGTGTTQIRIDNTTNLVGAPIPAGAFDLVAVVGQFITTLPYIGGYQLMPRTTGDIISTGPIISTFPVESNIQPTSLTISWQTLNNGTSFLRYGTTSAFELGVTGSSTPTTTHSVDLGGLQPAGIYYTQAFSVAGPDTSFATPLIVSTASPAQSTGEMNVYFSKSVNTSLAWFQQAQGNLDLSGKVVTRINNARRSIDVALYSLSGSPGDGIAAALVAAKNRGVKVRVICEYDTRNSNAYNSLIGNGVPLINDRFDAINDGVGLHHNKFFVVDARGGAPESVWVFMGSWNPTQPGTFDDYQNVVEVQDVALANAYNREFNEMWGSDNDTPNASASRFGARKSDNTPHRFVIAGKEVESYFSPSDRVTSRMVSAINAAEHSVAFALLTITRQDLGTAILGRKTAGKKVRGLVDNNTDTGSQYNFLLSSGVDMHLKAGPGLLHHKYGIIDAEDPNWNAITITGSHNWSNSAENANNENTLIIRDGNITNQFLQEFAARYYQFGGTDTIFVGVEEVGGEVPTAFSLSQNYPNPFNPSTVFNYQLATSNVVSLKVYDILGREVATLVDGKQNAGNYRVEFNAAGLSSGVYFYRLEAGSFVEQKKMILMK
ncbi:MAG: phospholipase D-like domain-containing protein [Bacteroidota bacterium]